MGEVKMINYILIGIYVILAVAGVTLFKLGAEKEILVSISKYMFSFKISLISLLGLLCYVCSFLLYMFLISNFDLTYIVPVTTGVIQVATIAMAVMIFKEALTLPKVAGTILVLIGVTIINLKK